MNQPDRKQGPIITEITNVPLLQVNNYQLSNGIEVYEVGGAIQDVIKLEIVFKAGRPYEPKKMVSKAVSYLMKEGTKDKSSVQIAEEFDLTLKQARKKMQTIRLKLRKYKDNSPEQYKIDNG